MSRYIMSYKQLITVSLSAFVLANCAGKQDFVPLPEVMQKSIGSTQAYIQEPQKEMRADIESSNISSATGGGLLVALIDCGVMAYREGKANDAMVDIQRALKDYNFQENLNGKLEHTLRSTDWLKLKQIKYVKEINDQTMAAAVKRGTSDVLLTSQFIYKLNPDFTVLTGTLYLTLYPVSAPFKKLAQTEEPLSKPIFKMHVSATSSLPSRHKSMEENGKIWAENNGESMKKALDTVINQVMTNLTQTLKHPNHLPEG